MVDVPSYHELESKIASLEAELDHLRDQKLLKEQHRVVASVAHEFNNIMMVIQGNISIMMLDTHETDPGFRRLKNMEHYIKAGSRLTEKLLDYIDRQQNNSCSCDSNPMEKAKETPSMGRCMDHYRQTSHNLTRVLLVDDEALILDVGTQMLAKIGMEVVTAENGNAAVERFRETPGEIDLVILDLIMPGIDGIDTFHLLREMDPYIKVIIASGYRKDERVEMFLRERQTGFIKKPFSLSQLSEKVKEVLNQGTSTSLSIALSSGLTMDMG